MPFWVYGNDSETSEPAEPFFSTAASEAEARAQAADQGIDVERVEEAEVELPDFPLPESFTPGGLNKVAGFILAAGTLLFGTWATYRGAVDPEMHALLIGVVPIAAGIFLFVKVARLQSFTLRVTDAGIEWTEAGIPKSVSWEAIAAVEFRASGPTDYLMGGINKAHTTEATRCTMTTSAGDEVVLTENNVSRFRYLVKLLRVECLRRDVEWRELRGSGQYERSVDPNELI